MFSLNNYLTFKQNIAIHKTYISSITDAPSVKSPEVHFHFSYSLNLPLLIISQFTLYGDCRNGRRPSFTSASPPELGEKLYALFCEQVRNYGLIVAKGRFRSNMAVSLINDGPVTMLLDSKRLF